MLRKTRLAHALEEYGDGEYNRADGAYNRTAARMGEKQLRELAAAERIEKRRGGKTMRRKKVDIQGDVRPQVGVRNLLEAVCYRML